MTVPVFTPVTPFRTGSGVPNDAIGNDGDIYLDDTTGRHWERISGHYGLVFQPTLPSTKIIGATSNELGYADAIVSLNIPIGSFVDVISVTCTLPDTSPIILEYGGGYLRMGASGTNNWILTTFKMDGTSYGVGGDAVNNVGILCDVAIDNLIVNPYKRIRLPSSILSAGSHTFKFSAAAGGSIGTVFGGSTYERVFIRVSKA